MIGYTSDVIPRKIYQFFYSTNSDLVGYIDSSLSGTKYRHPPTYLNACRNIRIGNRFCSVVVFNTSDFPTEYNKLGKGMDKEPEICQYRGYRNGPEHEDQYDLSLHYWVIYGSRLVFVVLFEVSKYHLSI